MHHQYLAIDTTITVPTEEPAKPNTLLIASLVLIMLVVLAVVINFFIRWIRRQKNPVSATPQQAAGAGQIAPSSNRSSAEQTPATETPPPSNDQPSAS